MPSNPGFEAVPAEVSTPIQILAPVQIACPFCKWNPNTWLLHPKCGVNGCKPLEALSDQIRWHVLGTHKKHNDSLPDDAPDKVDEQVFVRLAIWNEKRRNWSNPRAIWREMYAAIADLDANDPTIPEPEWTKDWVRASLDPDTEISAIKDRIADVKVQFEVRGLVQEIKHVRKRKDEHIAVLQTAYESATARLLHTMYGLEIQLGELNTELDDKVGEIEATSLHDIERLKTAIRNKLKLAPTQDDLLSEVGSFMGESGNEDTNYQDTPRLPVAQLNPNPTFASPPVPIPVPAPTPAAAQTPAHPVSFANDLDLDVIPMDTEMADMTAVSQPYDTNNSFYTSRGGFMTETPSAAFSAVPQPAQYAGLWGSVDEDYAHSLGTGEFSFTHVPSAANFSHNSEADTNDTSFPSQQSFGSIK